MRRVGQEEKKWLNAFPLVMRCLIVVVSEG